MKPDCLLIDPESDRFRLFTVLISFDFHVFTDDDQEGVMDNLLEALKTGSAFAVNRERKGDRRRTPRAAGG